MSSTPKNDSPNGRQTPAAADRAKRDTILGIPAALISPAAPSSGQPSSIVITPAETRPYTPRKLPYPHSITVQIELAEQVWRSVAHGLIVTDEQGGILSVNPALLLLLKYEKETDLAGRNIRSLLETPTHLDGVMQRLHNRCICAKRTNFRTQDGGILPAQVTASPIFTAEGNLRNMVFSLEDIKLQLEAEELRRQAELQQQTIAMDQARLVAIAELGYALNDPLQTLLGLAEEEQRSDYHAQIVRIIEIVRKFYAGYEARLRQAAAPLTTVMPPPVSAPQLTPCARDMVLIADDEAMIRRLFERMLAEAFPGLQIEQAENGRQAVEAFTRHHHAVIIMDVIMPELRGEAAFNQIAELCAKQQWELPHCIFCTGFMPSDTLNTITRDKRHALLRKPVARAALLEVMAEYLGRKAAV